MEIIYSLFGHGGNLTTVQMMVRGIVVFLLALLMLRVSGKKTFGKRSPADNVIMIMLGAILSRAIVGSSPFIPVIVTSFAIVLFHRLLAWTGWLNQAVSVLIRGEKLSLFKNGKENADNMKSALISKEDLLEGVRLQANSDSLENIQEIFIERNGQLSVVEKNTD